MTDRIDLPPRPGVLLESLRSIGYTLETALADVIDNSITAEAGRISVNFLWAGGTPWVAVMDDGHGMTKSELHEAMRFGSSSPRVQRSQADLGRFGLGMKTASISQCRRLTVVSKARGVIHACAWDLNQLSDVDSTKWELLVLDTSTLMADNRLGPLMESGLAEKDSGTIVLWEELDSVLSDAPSGSLERRFSASMDHARRHLETVFHRFLAPEPGKRRIKMDFNGTDLEPFDPFGPRHPARQELPLEIVSVDGAKVEVQPYVLPHHSKIPRADYEAFGGEEGYLQTQGFYVYRNRRLIVKGTWFRLIRKEELNKLIRVRVDIPNTLDHLWRIDVKKSQAEPPESVLRELRRIIQRIAGTGRRVYTRRATRLQQRDTIPVWRREVVDATVRYVLNEEHPLLQAVLGDDDPSRSARVRACFRLISASFPAELFYSDAANDELEFIPVVDDGQMIEVLKRLIEVLRNLGFQGDELRRQLIKSHPTDLAEEVIKSLLNGDPINA